jgi:carboxymethylenebutenolidase
MTKRGEWITLTGADGFAIGAYHVVPSAPKAGLVVAMEIFGVNGHIRDVCDGFAADGFEVIAPALYERYEKAFETGYAEDDVARARKAMEACGYAHTQGDVQAAIDALRANGRKSVDITGYCYGGSVAWLAACRCAGLASAVGYYGRHIIEMVGERPRCPTMLHFGRTDASIPMDWVEQIRAAHPDVIVHVYDAGHGFNSDRRTHYDAAAATLARSRTLAFFHENG